MLSATRDTTTDPLSAGPCVELGGLLYAQAASSCYTPHSAESGTGRRLEQKHLFERNTDEHRHTERMIAAREKEANASMVAALLPSYGTSTGDAQRIIAETIAEHGGPRLPPL